MLIIFLKKIIILYKNTSYILQIQIPVKNSVTLGFNSFGQEK